MKNPFVKFGVIAGSLILVYSVAVFAWIGDFSKLDANTLSMVEWLGYLRYLILLLAVLHALNYCKKNLIEELNYKKLLYSGLLVSAVVAAFVGLMEAGYSIANPDFMEQYGKLYLESKQAAGASEQELQEMKKYMEDYKWMQNPAASGIFYFFETFLLGVVFSAIGSFFFRKK